MVERLEEEHELLAAERLSDVGNANSGTGHGESDEEHEHDDGSSSGAKQRSVRGEYCLFLQHLSSTLTAGAYDFALFLYLVEIFPNTIVPASLVGLVTKLAGLIFANHMGGLVDRYPRLQLLRWTIAAQKMADPILCLSGISAAPGAKSGRVRDEKESADLKGFKMLTFGCIALLMYDFSHVWLAGVAMGSASLALANTVMEVAVERDWITVIAVDGAHLTQLNTRMRRIDLLSKLVAPLVVSLCTSLLSYHPTLLLLSLWVLCTCIAEYAWIHVVHRNLPVLARPPDKHHVRLEGAEGGGVGGWWASQRADWAEFMRMPIFASSLAIASIYLTTLSYDGSFIAYVKVARGHGDGFIALMRGVCVLTGLLGTLLMPLLESHIGLVRAGLWSISFELCCLLPAMLAFFIGTGVYGEHGPVGNQVLLFGGIAMSRVGLWSFDLCQLKELQQALDGHPRRNRLTALQLALQNVFDLLKYAMTLAAARPSEFKWTALGSFVAVGAGVACYAVYLRSMRGHLVHLDWIKRC